MIWKNVHTVQVFDIGSIVVVCLLLSLPLLLRMMIIMIMLIAEQLG